MEPPYFSLRSKRFRTKSYFRILTAKAGRGRASCFFDRIDYINIGLPVVYLYYDNLLATHAGYFLRYLEVSGIFRKFEDSWVYLQFVLFF